MPSSPCNAARPAVVKLSMPHADEEMVPATEAELARRAAAVDGDLEVAGAAEERQHLAAGLVGVDALDAGDDALARQDGDVAVGQVALADVGDQVAEAVDVDDVA